MEAGMPNEFKARGLARAFASPAGALFATGFLIGVCELLVHACWHPGRAPLDLGARGWLRGSSLMLLLYGAVGAVCGLLYSAIFAMALPRRGSRSSEDARRGAVWLFAWFAIAVECIWWSRFATLSGASFFSSSRLLEALGLALAALIPAIAIAALMAHRGSAAAQWSMGLSAALLLMSGVLPPRSSERSERLERVSRDDAISSSESRPSIVLVVVDALRAEWIPAMPRVAALADRGTTFARAFTTAPSTWPSLASVFTGRLPSEHGILRMSAEERLDGLEGTLAESLRQRGYHSTALVSGALANGSGLLRGFDELFELSTGRGRFQLASPWSVLRAELAPFRVLEKLRSKGDAERVASEAVRFLEAGPQQPFFLYVHLYATHVPYEPPAEYRERHPECGTRTRFTAEEARAIEEGRWSPTPNDWREIRALYAASVDWANAQIARIETALQASSAADRTLFIVTADHGEELGDHEIEGVPCVEHDWMWNTNLQVPLVIAGPGVPRGHRIPAARSLAALKPSLEQLVDGRPIEAVDLFRDADDLSAIAISENSFYRVAQDARWKLLRERRSSRELWFDLLADPGERNAIVDPVLTEEQLHLREALLALEQRERERTPSLEANASGEGTDPAVIEALRAAGYLGGTRPRDMMPRRSQ